MNLTKNVAFATNYNIKQRKVNFVAIFAHNLITATDWKQNNLQKITTDCGVGIFLNFDCNVISGWRLCPFLTHYTLSCIWANTVTKTYVSSTLGLVHVLHFVKCWTFPLLRYFSSLIVITNYQRQNVSGGRQLRSTRYYEFLQNVGIAA